MSLLQPPANAGLKRAPAPLCLLLSGLRGRSRDRDGRRRAPRCQQQHRRDRQHPCRPRSRGPRGWPARLAGRGVPSREPGSAGRSTRLDHQHVSLDDFVAVDEVFTTLCERAYAGEAACLQLIDEAATALAAGLAVLVNALDVDRCARRTDLVADQQSDLGRLARVDPAAAGGRSAAAHRRGFRGRRARRRSGCSGASPRPFPLPAAFSTAHGLAWSSPVV